MESDVISILTAAKTSSEAFKKLYRSYNAGGSSLTMMQIARALDFSSTGYVSDILNGKRVLRAKFRQAAAKAFGLKGEASRCLQLLILIDNERDSEKKKKLRRRLALVRKALRIVRRPPSSSASKSKDLEHLFFALEVFCAFGLFKNKPRSVDLVGYFGEGRQRDVERALQTLAGLNLVQDEGDCYLPLAHHWLLDGDHEGLSHLDFIRLALSHASTHVTTWFDRPAESAYISTIISTSEQQYDRLMPRMKSNLLMMQAELESGKADMLVRFNVQIYPVVEKP